MVKITRENKYQRTLRQNEEIKAAGYNLVVRWEHETPRPWWNDCLPKKRNEAFPCAIVYDFESYQDPTKRTVATQDLAFEKEHIPVSVSLADTLNRKSEHICSKAPEELVQKFWETVVRRGKVFREDIKQKYFPTDFEMLPKKQQLAINEWCHQIPVAGFNSGKYDLNLIKKYFVTHVGGEKTVLLQKKTRKDHVLDHTQFKILWHYQLFGSRHKLQKMGQNIMEVVRQNLGCHTSGSTVQTNWTMRACHPIGVGFQN